MPVPPPPVITAITWERVTVTLRLTAPDIAGQNPTFLLVAGDHEIPIAAESSGAEREIRINITRLADRAAIPNGTWTLHAVINGEPSEPAVCATGLLDGLDDASRVFLYNGNKSSTTVSFDIAEESEDLALVMRTYHFGRGGGKKTAWFNLPARFRKRYLSTAGRGRMTARVYHVINRVIGPKQGRVLFTADRRTQLEGNLLRVHDRLVERGLDRELDLRLAFLRDRRHRLGGMIRTLYLLATSEIVILDDYYAPLSWFELDRRTRLIQLWHAGSGFKSVGYSRFGRYGSPKLTNPHRQYTYAITGSTHLKDTYAEVFGIEPEAIIPTGLPRIDWFLDEQRTAAVAAAFRRDYPQLEGKRLILFAPTFRGRDIGTAHYPYEWIDFDALYRLCGADTVIGIRMHHFITDPVPIPEKYRDKIIDFTHFPDGNDLLHQTDVLITDYSSIIYEYALLDRPMLFYAPDKISYAVTRGFHRDYDEMAPGKVCISFDALVSAIESGDYEQEKVAAFRAENFDYFDTGAADRVIDWLIIGDPPSQERP